MCDPVSLMLAATATKMISEGVTGFQNAAMLDGQAKLRAQKAQFDADTARRRFHGVQGKQHALAAKSGFTLDSFDDFMHSSALDSAREISAIYTTGKAESRMLKAQASQQRFKTVMNMAGTALSGGSKLPEGSFSGSPSVSLDTQDWTNSWATSVSPA